MASPARQLDLYDPSPQPPREVRPEPRRLRLAPPLCANCHAKPARYGFRDIEGLGPAATLCFQCFHEEIMRRQEIAARLSRMCKARQADLPLDEARQADVRRRRAQIAARRALGIR